MPVLATAYIPLTAAGGSDVGPGVCPACGSERLEYLAGYYESGVCGPNGEAETRWQEAVRCRDCGETEEM
jgi:hypothetical protein